MGKTLKKFNTKPSSKKRFDDETDNFSSNKNTKSFHQRKDKFTRYEF